MQITAQLDDSYEARIATIQQSTHLDISSIIKQALDLLYAKTTLTPKEKNQRLIKTMTETAKDSEDLSGNYKELPTGFFNPITITSYENIAKRDTLYDR